MINSFRRNASVRPATFSSITLNDTFTTYLPSVTSATAQGIRCEKYDFLSPTVTENFICNVIPRSRCDAKSVPDTDDTIQSWRSGIRGAGGPSRFVSSATTNARDDAVCICNRPGRPSPRCLYVNLSHNWYFTGVRSSRGFWLRPEFRLVIFKSIFFPGKPRNGCLKRQVNTWFIFGTQLLNELNVFWRRQHNARVPRKNCGQHWGFHSN